jgi:hypothetical protein
MDKRRKYRRLLKRLYQKYLEWCFQLRRKNPGLHIEILGFLGFIKKRKGKPPRPFTPTMLYLRNNKKAFLENHHVENVKDEMLVPKIFSLHENYEETLVFIKKIYFILDSEKIRKLVIDYSQCERVTADAVALKDSVLRMFIDYKRRCLKIGRIPSFENIYIRNWQKPNLDKVMFTTGSISYFLGIKREFPNVKALPFLIGDRGNKNMGRTCELHITETMNYLEDCCAEMGSPLPHKLGKQLYDILGEIYINAEEHGSLGERFSLGFFERGELNDEDIGVLHFTVFNYGKTIYEVFKGPECQNKAVQDQMKRLSEKFTKNNWFKAAQFTEENLWTLYALQEGVTSHANWRRGHGTITFLDRFFQIATFVGSLKQSALKLYSGNTQIIFDGTYPLKSVPIDHEKPDGQKVKKLTFNKSYSFDEPPDKKFVNFVNDFFPGTLITAQIYLDKRLPD